MKVAKVKSSVQISGEVQSSQFEIVFDRHMVKILSDQLYEDKVLAIVRELSTNAVDSQKEAGVTRQFQVHLPSWDDMNFWIRDFGTGMSPEKVDNIYRKYGASDRNESNDFTGCMGLGSKTPFCYHTKTFTVDSWWDGKHYQYACFLNEDGMPEIAKMVDGEESDEPSGVKVTLPVKQYDRYDFEEAAQSVYKFFDQTPEMVGSSITIEKPNYTLENGNWKYDENEDYGMRIVMGNVAYRVTESALGELGPAQRKVVNAAFHVYVPIGEVGVTASREGLDYTNRTKTHIRAIINNIIKDFNKQAQDDISKAKNLWEARKRFVEYERASLQGIFDASKITYDGTTLFNEDGHIDFNDMVADGKIEVYKYTKSSWRQPERSRIRALRITSKNILFFDNDIKVGGFVRALHACKTKSEDVILVKCLDMTGRVDKDGNPVSVVPIDQIRAEFCEIMGFDESYMKPISTIPSPTARGTSGKKRGKTTPVMEYQNNKQNLKTEYWKNADVDIEDGGVYVEFNRFSVKMENEEDYEHPKVVYDILKILDNLDIALPTVYGIKTAVLSDFDEHPDWTEFWTWAKLEVEKKVAGKDLYSKEKYQKELDSLGYTGYYSSRRLDLQYIHRLAKHCNPCTQLAKFSEAVKVVEELAKGWEDLRQMRNACEYFNIPIKTVKTQAYNLKTKEDLVYQVYPLLKTLTDTQVNKCYEHVGLYINAVDG